jgi:perosamine synthetase
MIPVCSPAIGEAERRRVAECVESGWVSSAGPWVESFEEAWATYCDRRFGVAVSSGTAALEVALRCLDLQPGDEVVLPTFTIISCVLAVLRAGGVPVLVDSDPRTWCMNVDEVAEKIGPRTRAVLAVHIYGHPVDLDPLEESCRHYGLLLVEDAAEAHGAAYKGRRTGGFGVLACFSFYANKLVTTGEGGMVLTDDEAYAERIRSLRNLAFGPTPDRRFEHCELGYNFRLTSMQAALGLAQLETLDERIAARRRVARAYSDRLSDLPLQLPVEETWATNVYWMYGVVVNPSTGRPARDVASDLRARGVETRLFFRGMHTQPALRDRGLFEHLRFPVADLLSSQGLYLPCGPDLGEEQLDRVADACRETLS